MYGGEYLVVPKVVREMAEIQGVVGSCTNLQLIVLFTKILTVVSCEEGGFDGFDLLERVFCGWAG